MPWTRPPPPPATPRQWRIPHGLVCARGRLHVVRGNPKINSSSLETSARKKKGATARLLDGAACGLRCARAPARGPVAAQISQDPRASGRHGQLSNAQCGARNKEEWELTGACTGGAVLSPTPVAAAVAEHARGARKRAEETELGFQGRQQHAVLFFRSGRIAVGSRRTAKIDRARFGPGGDALSRPRPRLWPGRGGARRARSRPCLLGCKEGESLRWAAGCVRVRKQLGRSRFVDGPWEKCAQRV
jgi:hypothetical protein